MPPERAMSEVKEPHLVSLKVLRLSRPSLTEQHVIPLDTLAEGTPELATAAEHSHAYPSHDSTNPFILTPLLTFPPAFGSVFIGETFFCCLSAANDTTTAIDNVQITASMQTPAQQTPLPLPLPSECDPTTLAPGGTIQKVVSYDLKEEGVHVLAVAVAYGAGRTFRKLYQFTAQHCILVRTKTAPAGKQRAVLEAQLENMSDSPVFLERVEVGTRGGWSARGINWEVEKGPGARAPLLRSRDVVQVAFLLKLNAEEVGGGGEEDEEEGRSAIGQLLLGWRSSCGDRGILRTGRLTLAV